nr:dihydrolipoamide acetyltransferase family protein [Patulibacter sp. SYSU D01012]
MPQLGTSVAEGTILSWAVAVGEPVRADETICAISTDKVDSDCPAPASGTLATILVPEGETVDVGTVIARIATSGAPAADAGDPGAAAGGVGSPDGTAAAGRASKAGGPGPARPAGVPVGASPTPDAPGGGAGPAPTRREILRASSPVAARIAAELGVDVLALSGTGRNGRVTKRDVLAAAGAPVAGAADTRAHTGTADGPAAPATEAAADRPPAPRTDGVGASAPADGPAVGAEAPMHTESPYRHDPSIPVAGAAAGGGGGPTTAVGGPAATPDDRGGVLQPPSRMRAAIGRAMRTSLDTAAHCTTVVECDMTRLERERRERGLTALPLVAAHVVATLREFPALNATMDGEAITRYDRVHLGIAVSLGEDGLIVPVIDDAQDLSAAGLGRRIKAVAARARGGALTPDDVRGGTFTITNPGAAGALIATPVINLPQVAILDLEAIVRRPVVVTDADGGESIAIRSMTHLCLGWDHRALDGLYAAQFLTALRRRIEGSPTA